MPGRDEGRPARAGRWLPAMALLLALAALASAAPRLRAILRGPDIGIRDTAPSVRSAGPTRAQLERLQSLVSARVHVADVLVGESRWLEGAWIVQGDAPIGVDMSRAEIGVEDAEARIASISLPQPGAISARVDHEKSRRWDIRSRSWMPMVGALLGDRRAIEQQAMLEAQRLIERAAGSDDNKAAARRGVEGILAEFYGAAGWTVSVRWR